MLSPKTSKRVATSAPDSTLTSNKTPRTARATTPSGDTTPALLSPQQNAAEVAAPTIPSLESPVSVKIESDAPAIKVEPGEPDAPVTSTSIQRGIRMEGEDIFLPNPFREKKVAVLGDFPELPSIPHKIDSRHSEIQQDNGMRCVTALIESLGARDYEIYNGIPSRRKPNVVIIGQNPTQQDLDAASKLEDCKVVSQRGLFQLYQGIVTVDSVESVNVSNLLSQQDTTQGPPPTPSSVVPDHVKSENNGAVRMIGDNIAIKANFLTKRVVVTGDFVGARSSRDSFKRMGHARLYAFIRAQGGDTMSIGASASSRTDVLVVGRDPNDMYAHSHQNCKNLSQHELYKVLVGDIPLVEAKHWHADSIRPWKLSTARERVLKEREARKAAKLAKATAKVKKEQGR